MSSQAPPIAKSGRSVRAFSGHAGPVRGVDISPDALSLVSGAEDRTFRCWHLDWDYEIAGPEVWEEGARSTLALLLTRYGAEESVEGAPGSTDVTDPSTLERLVEDLARHGYAGLRREDVRAAIDEIESADDV